MPEQKLTRYDAAFDAQGGLTVKRAEGISEDLAEASAQQSLGFCSPAVLLCSALARRLRISVRSRLTNFLHVCQNESTFTDNRGQSLAQRQPRTVR